MERGLRNYWYPICRSDEVGETPVGVTRLCEDLVVWRDSKGVPHAFEDRCPHRGAALSIGRIWGDLLECKYHGFVFGGNGQCLAIPTERHGEAKAAKIRVPFYPTVEVGGAVWAYLHDGRSIGPPQFEPEPYLTDDRFLGWWNTWVFDANWLLVQDNNADLLHVGFLHNPAYAFGAGSMVQELRVRDIPNGFLTETVDAPLDAEENDTMQQFHQFAFKLPALVTLWIPPRLVAWLAAYHLDPASEFARPERYATQRAYRAVQYMFPIDEHHTVFQSWYGRRCENEEEREEWTRLYRDNIMPSEQIIYEQDNEAFRSLRGLDRARSSERLFNLDIGTIKMRKLLRDVYLAQQRKGGSADARGTRRRAGRTVDGRADSLTPAAR